MKDKIDDLSLAEIICTKICHDMAGAIGSVNNGVELLAQEPTQDDEMTQQVMELLSFSSKESLAKLQTYRIAYGRSSLANSDIEEMKNIIDNYFNNSKINITWTKLTNTGGEASINNNTRRILINILLLASSLLIYGGKISLSIQSNSFTISGSNDKIKHNPDIISILHNKNEVQTITPDNVMICYVKKLLHRYDNELLFEEGENNFTFKVSY